MYEESRVKCKLKNKAFEYGISLQNLVIGSCLLLAKGIRNGVVTFMSFLNLMSRAIKNKIDPLTIDFQKIIYEGNM